MEHKCTEYSFPTLLECRDHCCFCSPVKIPGSSIVGFPENFYPVLTNIGAGVVIMMWKKMVAHHEHYEKNWEWFFQINTCETFYSEYRWLTPWLYSSRPCKCMCVGEGREEEESQKPGEIPLVNLSVIS